MLVKYVSHKLYTILIINSQIIKKMNTNEPTVNESSRYELRDAANALGVSKGTLLRWTREKKITAHRSRVNGRHFWTGADLLRIWRAIM